MWILGDDDECIVFDAPHDVDRILEGVAGCAVKLIACTHAHSDHVNVIRELAAPTGAPVALHPADRELWDETHPDCVNRRSRPRSLRSSMRSGEDNVKAPFRPISHELTRSDGSPVAVRR